MDRKDELRILIRHQMDNIHKLSERDYISSLGFRASKLIYEANILDELYLEYKKL